MQNILLYNSMLIAEYDMLFTVIRKTLKFIQDFIIEYMSIIYQYLSIVNQYLSIICQYLSIICQYL